MTWFALLDHSYFILYNLHSPAIGLNLSIMNYNAFKDIRQIAKSTQSSWMNCFEYYLFYLQANGLLRGLGDFILEFRGHYSNM